VEGFTSVGEEDAGLPVIAGGGLGGASVTFFPEVTGGGDDGDKEGAGADSEPPPDEEAAEEGGEGTDIEDAGTRVSVLCFSCLTASPPRISTATIPAPTQYSLVSPPD
jgi:hypothetical protein